MRTKIRTLSECEGERRGLGGVLTRRVELDRISFKSALDTVRHSTLTQFGYPALFLPDRLLQSSD